MIFQSVCCAWSQADKPFDYDQIIEELEKELHEGKKRTLRDFGSLLDKPEISHKIRLILANATFFTPEEIDVLHTSKSEFLQFYYDNEQNIQYSELLDAYYVTPLESRKVNFEMQSVTIEDISENTGLIRRLFLELDELLSLKKHAEAISLIEKIGSVKAPNKENFLIDLVQDERLPEAPYPLRKQLYENILNQLAEFPDIEIVNIVLQLMEAGLIKEPFSTSYLTTITNCPAPFQSNQENTIKYYQHLKDSLETLEEIRQYGYDRVFKFNVNFFQNPVDYYGKILGLSAPFPWIKRNALLDLKRSNHPRALFYIAVDFYRTRKNLAGSSEINHVQLIKSRTNVEIGIENSKGEITFHPDKHDEKAMLNYLIYWASSYPDYEWDENRNIFTSKMESFAKTQNYERLFRRFNSKDDSIALLSFLQLTEGDPVEVITLAAKYRQLLLNPNNSLPSMKSKYLEQLTLLTAFCRKNKISYQADKKLLDQLEKLAFPETEKERYFIENQLIETLTLEDITALEYWACVREKNESLSLSVGRILDWFYSKNWKSIVNDKDHLRLYLKKSYLFQNIGVEGICNNYLNKFDQSDKDQMNRLLELSHLESDQDILNQILLLLEQEPEAESTPFNIDEFIDTPLLFSQKDIKILPPPSLPELDKIIAIIKESEEEEVIKKLFSYLRLHSDPEYIPALFRLIDDDRIISRSGALQISVADNIIPVVENIYSVSIPPEDPDHVFATDYWRSLWKKDSANYRSWGNRFYQLKIDSLAFKTDPSIEEINLLTQSPFYSEKYKPELLKALKKVRPIKNFRQLQIQPKLSVTGDLKYFEDLVFTYKDLDDIPKLFDINNENANEMLAFLIDKTASFNYSEKGSFYNNLCRLPWLNDFINSGKITPAIAETIKNTLNDYLNESSFLSEFEEQTTLLNIAKIDNAGKSLTTKLDAVFQMDADPESKAKIIEEIIATVTYAELDQLIANFDQISNILGDNSCNFFHRDFGLPIFRIDNQKELEELLHNHQTLSEFEFYTYYLKAFRIDFLDKKGNLDFGKICDILQFDIVSPFASDGRGKRDEYLFGIVRLLEIHFNTRLGFHEKLNESQTFYNFSSSTRAEAWIGYLQQNGLINKKPVVPVSFNFVKNEIKTISGNSANKE